MPARRRVRCQSAATASRACLAVLEPCRASDTPVRSVSSSVLHVGWAGVGTPVSIARAAVGGQPSLSARAGSFSTEPRGGALPRSIERSCHFLLQAIRMNSIDQSAFFAYFDTARKWPSTQVLLWLLSV